MTIENVTIRDLGGTTGFVCKISVVYADLSINNISYFPASNYLCCDSVYHDPLSKNVKNLCKRAWRKKAREMNIKLEFGF